MDAPPVITFLTDYGLADEFVGVCHGVIARVCPAARVIDVSHQVPPGAVMAGAVLLANAIAHLPVAVHVGVVDPSVGTERRAIAGRAADGRILVGPDNGLLWPAAETCGGLVEAVDISQSSFRLEPVSATFHGRDIFCPVAARLASGEPLAAAGEPVPVADLVRLELPRGRLTDGGLIATVLGIDRFGNVQLSASAEDLGRLAGETALGAALRLRLAAHERHVARFARTFADGEPGRLILYEDAAGRLAIAFNGANAAARLGLRIGAEVAIEPPAGGGGG